MQKIFSLSDRPWGLFGPIVWWKKFFMRISPLFWNLAYFQQLTLEYFGGRDDVDRNMFYSHKILHQNKRNTTIRTNEQNLCLYLLVSPVNWSAAPLSLCVLNTWPAWNLDDQVLFMKFQKELLVLIQAKICFTLLANDMWGTFVLRHLSSPSFFLVDGKVIYIVVSHSFLRNHWKSFVLCPFSFLQWKCLQPKLIPWLFFCVHNLPLLS